MKKVSCFFKVGFYFDFCVDNAVFISDFINHPISVVKTSLLEAEQMIKILTYLLSQKF